MRTRSCPPQQHRHRLRQHQVTSDQLQLQQPLALLRLLQILSGGHQVIQALRLILGELVTHLHQDQRVWHPAVNKAGTRPVELVLEHKHQVKPVSG